MKWSETYATGNRQIDEQHKRIFEMTEDCRVSLDEGAGEKTPVSSWTSWCDGGPSTS